MEQAGICSENMGSPDGRNIASVSIDRTIQIWNVHLARPILTLDDHTLAGTTRNGSGAIITWSPDGAQIASVNQEKVVQIWQGSSK